jgi:hypothetical protein
MLLAWEGADMNELGLGDRVTLRAWRIANVVGWSTVAIAGSIVLRLAAESAAGLWGIGFDDVVIAGHGWRYLLIFALPSAALIGGFVGYIAGTRLGGHPVATAAVLTVVYASGAAWLFWGSFRYGNGMGFLVGLMISGYLSVPIAVLLARVLALGPMRPIRRS